MYIEHLSLYVLRDGDDESDDVKEEWLKNFVND